MEGLLEEYKTLREEIIKGKERRMQSTSMMVTAMGAFLTITATAVFSNNIPTAETRFLVSIGGGIAMYCVLIPCQVMIKALQQTINRTGDYIETFIESRQRWMNYETIWHAHKKKYKLPKGLHGLGGIFFFLAFLPWLLPAYTFSVLPNLKYCLTPTAMIVIGILLACFITSIIISIDMHIAHSNGWKWKWSKPRKKRAPNYHRRYTIQQ